MGVRISAYAVDLSELDRFLDAPLGKLMFLYYQNAPAKYRTYHWEDWSEIHGGEQDNVYYSAVPGRGISRRISGAAPTLLTPSDIECDEFLQTTARTQLQQESSLKLDMFLDGLSASGQSSAVRCVTRRDRRWWIGSLLQAAADALDSEAYCRLEQVLIRTLRGYGCGLKIPESPYTLADVEFPVVPNDDTDHWMSVWMPDEIRVVVGCFQVMHDSGIRFRRPPGKVGIAPDSPGEWDDWVREMLNQFLVLPEQPHESLRVVTFIDG